MYGEEHTVAIDPTVYNSQSNGLNYLDRDHYQLYPTVASDWRSQEAYASMRNQPTYRYKGWCIVKFNCSFVDFYDMEENQETIRMTIEEFGSSVFFLWASHER